MQTSKASVSRHCVKVHSHFCDAMPHGPAPLQLSATYRIMPQDQTATGLRQMCTSSNLHTTWDITCNTRYRVAKR